MTKIKNINLDSMEVLAAMLEATKHNGKRHNLTLEEAFEDIIKGSYKYSKGWYEDTYNKKYYTCEQYKNILYNFIEENILELPMPMLYYLTKYFNGYDYRNLDNDSFKIIKEYAELELEERKEIERLERETQEIRHILKKDFLIRPELEERPLLLLHCLPKLWRNVELRWDLLWAV